MYTVYTALKAFAKRIVPSYDVTYGMVLRKYLDYIRCLNLLVVPYIKFEVFSLIHILTQSQNYDNIYSVHKDTQHLDILE